jgi:hypothetical protein
MAKRFQNPWTKGGQFGHILDSVLDTSKVLGTKKENQLPMEIQAVKNEYPSDFFNSLLVINVADSAKNFEPGDFAYNWMVTTSQELGVRIPPQIEHQTAKREYVDKITAFLRDNYTTAEKQLQKQVDYIALASHASNAENGVIKLLEAPNLNNAVRIYIDNLNDADQYFFEKLGENVKPNGAIIFICCKLGAIAPQLLINIAQISNRACYFSKQNIQYSANPKNAVNAEGPGYNSYFRYDGGYCSFLRVSNNGGVFDLDRKGDGSIQEYHVGLNIKQLANGQSSLMVEAK